MGHNRRMSAFRDSKKSITTGLFSHEIFALDLFIVHPIKNVFLNADTMP